MNYPLISEYIEAIKSAEDNFNELPNLQPVLDDDGQPVMTGGNFAVVFKMQEVETGKFYALKCFTKEQEGRGEAYHLIAEELKDVDSPYLINIRYLDKELFVDTTQTDETEFPVLLMDWVEGKTLDKYLRENLDNKYALEMLAYRFSQLAQWLIPQPFAHGDLKPDNILVREDGTLVLVDYDGMYVPAIQGKMAREAGSPDYQNPNKKAEEFDENIDSFSLISIYLSLSIIAHDSGTLARFGSADRLLFSVNDYLNLQKSELYCYIQETFSSNGKIRRLSGLLNMLCGGEPLSSLIGESIRRILTKEIVNSFTNESNLPSAEEYINAFLNHTFYFRTLNHIKTITGNDQVTYFKGSNSVVFKVQDEQTGKYYALKCYTDTKGDIYNRLELVKEKMLSVESPYLVKMQILHNEININDNYLIGEESYFYPIVLMDWVDGVTMDRFESKTDVSEDDFKKIIYNYQKMASWLLEQNFSHGDVSPKNIIITNDHKTIIVDYDNMVFGDEDIAPDYTNNYKDENFCNPCMTSNNDYNSVDCFPLVSIMISLIYYVDNFPKSYNSYYTRTNRSYYGRIPFFNKEDYKDLDNSNLYKTINKCHSWHYQLDVFILCLKQSLRSVLFSKEQILYLFKDRLYRSDDSPSYQHEEINAKLETITGIIVAVYGVMTFIAPFILVSYTQLRLLSISLCIFISNIIFFLSLFTVASFRPDKNSRLHILGEYNIGFGCLGGIGVFMPVLFMSDHIKDMINSNISWLHLPVYDERWYITAIIWILFFFSSQIYLNTFWEKVYDYDDVKNIIYQIRRKRFINRLSEDEYNFNYSKEFKDSRLIILICLNIFVIFGFLYALYGFYFLHVDLIYTNIIIAALTLVSFLLVKPILKEKYSTYSHKAEKVYSVITLTKVFLPLITIPFAFHFFTEFLNSSFGISIPPYDLGVKEFVINTILYIIIYCIPCFEFDYVR